MKKFIAELMAIVLLITSPICGELSFAGDGAVESDEMAVISEESLTVKGTDSFGEMLASSLSNELDEQDYNNGYNIFSIEVQGKEAEVSFETIEDATLVVGIYDENGTAMLGAGKSEVTAEETEAVISIDINSMPQFFYLRGFLVDSDTLRPFCTVYESPNYTKEMQDFLAKTTDDFDADRVLNLDSDKTNNFAVYSNQVTVISGSGITIESADEEANTYIFKNADSIAALHSGEMFSYQCADGSVLVVKVNQIQVDGDIVTVTGTDTSLEEAFEYVKIDTTTDMSHVTVDDSACGEGVVYNGIVDDAGEERGLRSVEGEGKYRKSLSYTFFEDKAHGIAGDVKLNLEASIKVYISLSSQYIEAKIDYSAKAKVKISDKNERKLPLGFVGISPIPGVFIEFTPSFVTKVSASLEISGELKGTVGFRATGGKGIENISKAPHFEMKLKGEFTVFVGLSMEPKIKIVSDYLANASLDASVGAEAKGVIENEKASASKIHECNACVDGDISAKAEIKFKTELLNSDKLTFEDSESYNFKICDWYFSFDFGEFGLTACPHVLYKTTITVSNNMKKPVSGAEVKVPFTVVEKDENGKENRKEIASATTDENGRVEGYLKSGKYDVSVTAEKYKKASKQITVEDDAKSIRIMIWNTINEGGEGDDKEDDTKPPVVEPGDEGSALRGKNVQTLSLGASHSGAITEDGSLYMWGYNYYGELGDGTRTSRNTPVKVLDHVVSVSLGYYRSGAITEDGSLYMWGNNFHGELGDGTRTSRYTPLKVLDHVVSVSLGSSHSGAITEDGSLYMWGYNFYGELGDGTTTDRYTPVKVLDHVESVSLGEYYSGAITEDGSLYMWGYNTFGRLGDGTTTDRYTPVKMLDHVVSVSLGRSHSGAITEDGSLYMWGYNYNGKLGDGTTTDRYTPVKVLDHVESVSLGYFHSGAITEDGSLYMWGDNSCGQLGDGGTTVGRHEPSKVMDHIKLKSESNNLNSFIADTEPDNHFSIRGLRNLLPTDNIDNGSSQTASFDQLKPNAVYNFYVIKDKDSTELLNTSNLLYMAQFLSDGSGRLSVSYTPRAHIDDADIFVVGAKRDDISSASVSLSDMEYTGSMQYAKPTVTYREKILTEFEDYELLGDYSAQDVGTYTVTIHGIGEYKGAVTASYKISEAKSKKVQKISLSIADTSLTAGKTLQLKAEIIPANAENKTLRWTSDNKSVAIVDSNGLVTAVGEGKATITASSTDGSNISASCVISVTKKSEGGDSTTPTEPGTPTNPDTPTEPGTPTPPDTPTNPGTPTNPNVPTTPGTPTNPSTPTNPGIPTNPSQPDDSSLETTLLYYIVKFDANGGKNLSRKTMTLLNDDNLGILPKTTRKNYTFKGWYTQKTGGKKVTKNTVLNAATTLYAQWTKVTKPTQVLSTSLEVSKKGQLTVSVKKVKGATGYEIAYSTNKKFPASATKKVRMTALKKTLKNLKSGKTYYVKIRAYKTDSSGNRIYGAYSVVKNISVKQG
ncbi:Ig-like domain-containing protein [Lachnospiraceae bacterium 47-T17]